MGRADDSADEPADMPIVSTPPDDGVGAEAEPAAGRRVPTSTSNFGVGKRESHDASAFYERFTPPALSDDDEIAPHKARDEIWCADARDMDAGGDIADGSVALVVTSPPYFAGKAYEEALGEGHIPADYVDYLGMLTDVFAECARKLEPGGRIAVNVANLGRKPYRSLSADVIGILERLGLLLRGEIIWRKARGAGGNCAWGSFQRPGNPVVRDVSERVIVASKGRFDRAVSAPKRARAGLPHEGSITVDEFMDATLDVWELAPESAKRVNHPAPFPVELPRRLIELYTYVGDLVLDPFMGAGSTAVAAARTGRHFVGFDTDPAYVAAALDRVATDRSADDAGPEPSGPSQAGSERHGGPPAVVVPPTTSRNKADLPTDALLVAGRSAVDVAVAALGEAGFAVSDKPVNVRGRGVQFDRAATGPDGTEWLVLVAGSFTAGPTGLRRSDVVWRTLAHAAVVADLDDRVLVLTTEEPAPSTAQGRALTAGGAGIIDATVVLTAPDLVDRLRALP